ncbi:2-keto-4-pentenoate hydratase [Mycolicibacterium novocastrense]|uniref:2-keto-4-pentenoate hydratase n=1 Tax=Mycolicibacterium novocastrense TaxID=59813 RepID=UPI000749D939|nr:fumarylacetoacetate hydrolase family protein [Mycolicibacterium novocastrense]KUH67479.1 2-keto-4-pentenoate hydratase [Mycolicibacterium novocastrense]KUH68199.1 2-keto-4-pentenoate hydratase [Mycolicibacterium novocastrense]KUH74389.1 2-keto-4-pentenoate hydratase [Mycolicibacterium novocastrense]
MSLGEFRAQIVAQSADRILSASRTRQPVEPVRNLLGSDDIALAYAVQQELTRRREAAGGVVVGRKIGLTSPSVQRQLGVNQPDFGVLFADMDVTGAVVVPPGRLLQPRVEAEVAFVLKEDLVEGELHEEQIRHAVDYCVAALEIVDSRIANWDIAITDTVADNASSGLFILADKQLGLEQFVPADIEMRMYADDTLVSEGTGTACLGGPLAALGWLARTARDYGSPLEAGQIVLSGALGPMVPAVPGALIRADVGPLGSVSALFAPDVDSGRDRSCSRRVGST